MVHFLVAIICSPRSPRVLTLTRTVVTVCCDVDFRESLQGQVQFADVSFSYPTRPNVQVLTNFNVQLRPGTVTALVGESGSGKSTVAWLLERFFDPSGGTVTLDGQDIRQLDPHWLRQQIGLVNQEPSLFASTVAENIRYGNPNADDASVREAGEYAVRTMRRPAGRQSYASRGTAQHL